MRKIGNVNEPTIAQPTGDQPVGRVIGHTDKDSLSDKLSQKVSESKIAKSDPNLVLSEPEIQAQPLQRGLDTPVSVKNTMPPTLNQQVEEANARGEQHPSQSAAKYEASSNYPPVGMTTLSPSLDVAFAGQLAKDVGVGVAKVGAKVVGRIIGNIAERKALGRTIGSIKESEAALKSNGVPTEPITAEPVVELTHATRTKAADNIMKEGFKPELRGTGADEVQKVKGFMGEGVSMAKNPSVAQANVEDVLAKSETSHIKSYLPKKDVLTVTKQSHPEVYDQLLNPDPNVTKPIAEAIINDAKAKGFKAVSFPDGETVVTSAKDVRKLSARKYGEPVEPAAGASEADLQKYDEAMRKYNAKNQPELDLKGEGDTWLKYDMRQSPTDNPYFQPIPKRGPATDISLEKGVMIPPSPQRKALTRAAEDIGREPLQADMPKSGMLDGAEKRIAAFAEGAKATPDVAATNPLTSRYEMNKQLGTLENTAREQLQTAAKAEVAGEQISSKKIDHLYKTYGFKPESMESAAVKVYGEAKDKLTAQALLRQNVGEAKANKIIEAENYMAKEYKDYLGRLRKAGLNIAERQDYHNHINEINILNDVGLMTKAGTPEGEELAKRILTDAEQGKLNKFMRVLDVPFNHLKRKGGADVDDAVTGFARYAKESERYIAMQPYVKELQATADAVEGTMPNLAMYLRNQSDYIAGKKQAVDSSIQSIVGPEGFRAFVELTNRMKGNILQANPSVAYSQLFSLPVTAGAVPVKDFVVGAAKSMANPSFRDFMYKNSPVIQSRILSNAERGRYDSAATKSLDAVTAFLDTNIIGHAWAAKFNQLIGEGKPVDEAISLAEEFASMTNGFLSKTNTPEMLRSQTAQSLMPFMNQVLAQSRYVVREMFKGKSLAGKAGTAVKMGLTGSAIGIVGSLFDEDKEITDPVNPMNYIPMGPAASRGLGGPVLSTTGRIMNAKSMEERLMEIFKGLLLSQKKIPAGLMVGKGVEELLKDGE